MKKLFLLIIASWATSCLPVPGTQRFSALQIDKITQANQTLTKTNKELEKKDILNQSFHFGALSGAVGVPIGCTFFGLTSLPFVVPLALSTAALSSLLQDKCYIRRRVKKYNF